MSTPYPERNNEMVERRNNGETYVKIAADYGLTPIRIRQIVMKHNRSLYRLAISAGRIVK